jgi:predicted small secreted protein
MMMKRKIPLILALLIVSVGLGGCSAMGGNGMTVRQNGMKVNQIELLPCTSPNGCAQGVTMGKGIWGSQLKYVLHQQPTRDGRVVSNVAINSASPGLINTLAPVALSGWAGWQAAALQAGAIKWAASHQRGQQFIIQGGDAQALQHTEVDVVQNPGDLDANIEETHLYPAPPGN